MMKIASVSYRLALLLAILGSSSAAASLAASESNMGPHRMLSGSGDGDGDGDGGGDEDQDDDGFWAFDDGSSSTIWSNYNIEAKKCINFNKQHVVVFELYGKGNNQCSKKKKGTYYMDVGQFSRAYVKQMRINAEIQGYDYDKPESLEYTTCTLVEYNGNYYYVKLGCTSASSLKILTYSDEYCKTELNTNAGVYNDISISFNTCHDCVTWPQQNYGDDGEEEENDVDDYFHQFESKLCSAADYYKKSCGWGCKRLAKSNSQSNSNAYVKHTWSGFEKFFLFFWSLTASALVWVVLKQRRMMSREDAIVEEAAMQGVGLKKRHIFPIALGIIFCIILSMFMVWKHLAWILLIGTNVGLFAHFVFLRRKARRAAGATGYHKDAGLQIS